MEMKKAWTRPLTTVQQFDANEAISACGDSGVVYNFKCTGGGGAYGGVWEETNGIAGLQPTGQNADRQISRSYDSYHACNATHRAESNSGFIMNCYFLPASAWPFLFGEVDTSKAINVVVWTDNGTNVHCTEDLDMSTWETAKS